MWTLPPVQNPLSGVLTRYRVWEISGPMTVSEDGKYLETDRSGLRSRTVPLPEPKFLEVQS